MASSSSSGLTFKLHPLVIVNISDHYTRVKSQSQPPNPNPSSTPNGESSTSPPPPPPRVFGCVIGVQRGRTVEIFNSFELLFDPSTNSLDRPFLEKKQELCQFLLFSLSTLFSTSIYICLLYLGLRMLVYQIRVWLGLWRQMLGFYALIYICLLHVRRSLIQGLCRH